jgi:hypothetical protein
MYSVSSGLSGRQSDGLDASSICCIVGADFEAGAAARDDTAAAARKVAAIAASTEWIFMVTSPWSEGLGIDQGFRYGWMRIKSGFHPG